MTKIRMSGWKYLLAGAIFGCTTSVDLEKKESTDPSGNTGLFNDPDAAQYALGAAPYDGVDLLVVVDNSGSMAEEQAILSNGMYSLVNALTKPLLEESNPGFGAESSVRLAVVSSDLGLMSGEDHQIAANPQGISTCEDPRGDNGAFLPESEWAATTVQIADRVIRCDANGDQCPVGFVCEDGYCAAPMGISDVGCPGVNDPLLTNSPDQVNPDLPIQAACAVQLGTNGCGFEQQLEAAVVGLENHPEFLQDSHVLAVLFVSDEEDGSIMDPGLFATPEWLTPQIKNTAAWVPEANQAYLFPTARYYDKLLSFKHGDGDAVMFGAIVGVPTRAASDAESLPNCEGTSAEIGDCLNPSNTPMRHVRMEFTDPMVGTTYHHLAPACTRTDVAGVDITVARPGRRFVETAQMFENSFVYSICNADWTPAANAIASLIPKLRRSGAVCFPQTLDPEPLPAAEQSDGCTDCGRTTCDLYVQYSRSVEDGTDCPAALYEGLTDTERAQYEAERVVTPLVTANGNSTQNNIYCVLPQAAVPVDCSAAHPMMQSSDSVAWYYCREETEDFEEACLDGVDNDGDSDVDGNDAECEACNTGDVTCDNQKCKNNVRLTASAELAVTGLTMNLFCSE